MKVRKALVVWFDDKTKLSDISQYFKMENNKRAYQTFWIRNIMASREVWEFYGRLSTERRMRKTRTLSGR